MSRVGKMPLSIPNGTTVDLNDDQITIKSKTGSLTSVLNKLVIMEKKGDTLHFEPVKKELRESDTMTGTMRQLVANMIKGVNGGFEEKLSLVGVGYKAQVGATKLIVNAGYSHPVEMEIPKTLKVDVAIPTEILIKGADKQVVGQFAAEVRAIRPPEPYKGKGIRYATEKVVIKETKKK